MALSLLDGLEAGHLCDLAPGPPASACCSHTAAERLASTYVTLEVTYLPREPHSFFKTSF